jgi:catechol 2,3-dioxygenase-like lactoylglutathione lyase family enzyme
MMENVIPSNEQLVVELYVQDIEKSIAFYRNLGFKLTRSQPDFAVLQWENSMLFLEQIDDQPAPPSTIVANIRIMVPNVDHYWELSQDLDVIRPIANRGYGLTDFTIRSIDGIGLRFSTRIKKPD